MSSKDTQFKKGNPGGPGRPKGSVSGRKKCLQILDSLLDKSENQEKFADALQKQFDKNPVAFWRGIVLPLSPKDVKISPDNIAGIRIEFTNGHDSPC